MNSRGKLLEKNAEEMDDQTVTKKANVVLSVTMQDSPAATLGSSFSLQYDVDVCFHSPHTSIQPVCMCASAFIIFFILG